MLRVHCPRHDRAVLLPTSGVRRIDTTAGAHLVHWRCSCGADGTTRVPRRPGPDG